MCIDQNFTRNSFSASKSTPVGNKLATIVEGNPKAPFSIATTPMCRGGRYSFPKWIFVDF